MQYLMLLLLLCFCLGFNALFAASEQSLARIEELSELCSKNLRAALVGGRESEVRKNFEANLKELRSLCAEVQKDINKYNLGISLIHDINFINESFEKIKKMKQLAPEHYLFNDMNFIFTEFDYKLKDLRKTGLYVKDEPTPPERNSDYLLELFYLLDKLEKQGEETTFCKIKGSRIRDNVYAMVMRVQFLAAKAQNAVNANNPDNKIPSIAAEANTMVQMYTQIINNVTDKNPKAISQWNKAIQNLYYAVKKAIDAGIEAPVK